MAKRDRRQTKRERKEEARRRRLEEIKRIQRRGRMRRIGSLVVVLAIGAGIFFVVSQSGRSAREARATLDKLAASAGCGNLEDPIIEGNEHIEPPATVQYKTVPPTSGNHYGSPGPTGVHPSPIQNEIQVHNLEHGHVAIQYNGIPQALQNKLAAVARTNDQWILMAPYPQMSHKVALTSWGRVLTCDSSNDKVADVAKEFVKQFRDKSPRESIPGQPLSARAGS